MQGNVTAVCNLLKEEIVKSPVITESPLYVLLNFHTTTTTSTVWKSYNAVEALI